MLPDISGDVAVSGDAIELVQGAVGKVGSGTAIKGLRPGVSVSVELKGTAPFANVELSTLAGAGAGSAFAQISPEGAATPNGDVTAVPGNVSVVLGNIVAEPGIVVMIGVDTAVAGVVTVVLGVVAVGSGAAGSTGKIVFDNPFTGHGIMLLAAMPPTGAPRSRKTVPSPNAGALAGGLVTPAGLDSVVATGAEVLAIPAIRGATCAALVAHPSKTVNAVAPNNRPAFRSRFSSNARFIFG
jgi:hypothetical protein